MRGGNKPPLIDICEINMCHRQALYYYEGEDRCYTHRNTPKYNKWESHHLSFEQLRGFITSALRENGWEVRPETLRIYGYGEEHTKELAGFQGHIEIRSKE